MMKQYLYTVTSENKIYSDVAYPFYAWLLRQMSDEDAETVHRNSESLINQSVYTRGGQSFWRIHLLQETMLDIMQPILQNRLTIPLSCGQYHAECIAEKAIPDTNAFLRSTVAADTDSDKTVIRFLTPTAFRQNGRYMIFPSERLILQSLVNKWNLCCLQYPFRDDDAFCALENGLRITEYRLKSAVFPLKATKIPGFVGEVTLQSHLPAALAELWKILRQFAPYSGIGIKSTLGMGAVEVETLNR